MYIESRRLPSFIKSVSVKPCFGLDQNLIKLLKTHQSQKIYVIQRYVLYAVNLKSIRYGEIDFVKAYTDTIRTR